MSSLRKEYKLAKERRMRSIAQLVKEAVINVIAEQDLDLSGGGQTQAPGAAAAGQQSAPQADAQPPAVVTPDQTVPRQYTVDDMIQELNAVRSGRSFTDPEIYGRLVTFFKGLEAEQRTVLDTLLKQIAELVTGVIDAPTNEQQPGAQNGMTQPAPPPPGGAPQQSAPMPGAQTGAGAAGVGQV